LIADLKYENTFPIIEGEYFDDEEMISLHIKNIIRDMGFPGPSREELPFIESSDAHIIEDIGKGFTAIYMEKPSISEFK